jgi:hypothetical protein
LNASSTLADGFLGDDNQYAQQLRQGSSATTLSHVFQFRAHCLDYQGESSTVTQVSALTELWNTNDCRQYGP